MLETNSGNPLKYQIDDIIQKEEASDILEIDADFAFSRIPELPVYDIIIMQGVAEYIDTDDTKMILNLLLAKVKKQVMLITPEYCQGSTPDGGLRTIRKYHPVMLGEFDFAYSIHDADGRRWQMYNIFPPKNYEPLSCDTMRDLRENVSARFNQKLRIAYIIPHHKVTGGVKALLQQMKHLASNGHIVKAYYRTGDDACHSAIPSWSEIKDGDISEQHVISSDQQFLDCIDDVDIIMLTWMASIPEFENARVPVVLWEQGSQNIFGDRGKALTANAEERAILHYLYRRPVHILAVSPVLVHIFQNVYNRKAQYFPNGIDTEFYRPGTKMGGIPVIMIMGHPNTPFKGTEFAFEVLDELWDQHVKFKVWWALPGEFSARSETRPYQVEVYIKPEQERLAELYRQATLFFSTSLYESFPLPPMEAMASGTAVVATDNGGIRTYGRSGENCILVEQGDRAGATTAIRYLLENKSAREAFEKAGRDTALVYRFEKIVKILENCLYQICGKGESRV